MNKMKIPLILFLLMLSMNLFSQEKFDQEALLNAKKYGKEIAGMMSISEIDEFDLKTVNKNQTYLKNGLRSSDYIDTEKWLDLSEKVSVKKIAIIFSKSVSCSLMISSSPSISHSPSKRSTPLSGSSITAVSGRLPQERIKALDRLRWIDHMAMRIGCCFF